MEIEHNQIRLGLDKQRRGTRRVVSGQHPPVARPLKRPPQKQQIHILVIDGENPKLAQVVLKSHKHGHSRLPMD